MDGWMDVLAEIQPRGFPLSYQSTCSKALSSPVANPLKLVFLEVPSNRAFGRPRPNLCFALCEAFLKIWEMWSFSWMAWASASHREDNGLKMRGLPEDLWGIPKNAGHSRRLICGYLWQDQFKWIGQGDGPLCVHSFPFVDFSAAAQSLRVYRMYRRHMYPNYDTTICILHLKVGASINHSIKFYMFIDQKMFPKYLTEYKDLWVISTYTLPPPSNFPSAH